MNNFKELEEKELRGSPLPPRVARDINQNIGVLRFISNIIELYMPKVAELFVSLSGGNMDTDKIPPNLDNRESGYIIKKHPEPPLD